MTLPWPDVPTSLFSTLAGTSRFAVNLSWFRGRPKDVYAFKRGYRDAATRLAETVRASSDNRLPDFLVWPIVWLWRHHLELALKEVIACGEKLESRGPWTWPSGLRHDFKKIWTRAHPLIESLNDEPTASSTEMATGSPHLCFSSLTKRLGSSREPCGARALAECSEMPWSTSGRLVFTSGVSSSNTSYRYRGPKEKRAVGFSRVSTRLRPLVAR